MDEHNMIRHDWGISEKVVHVIMLTVRKMEDQTGVNCGWKRINKQNNYYQERVLARRQLFSSRILSRRST